MRAKAAHRNIYRNRIFLFASRTFKFSCKSTASCTRPLSWYINARLFMLFRVSGYSSRFQNLVIVPKNWRANCSVPPGKVDQTCTTNAGFQFRVPLRIYTWPRECPHTLKPHGTLQLAHNRKFRWHTHKIRRHTDVNLPLQLARIFISRSLRGGFPCGLPGMKPTIWNWCQKERTLIQNWIADRFVRFRDRWNPSIDSNQI